MWLQVNRKALHEEMARNYPLQTLSQTVRPKVGAANKLNVITVSFVLVLTQIVVNC